MELLLQRISWEKLNSLVTRSGAGRPAYKLSVAELLSAILFHFTFSSAGTLAQHLMLLVGTKMAESSLSQRRQALPFEVFRELMRLMLRPLEAPCAQGTYQELRLVALDGVSFSLPNTPEVNAQLIKGSNQHGKAAFAKLQCSVLVELLPHNPLAACLGLEGQSEWKLSHGLLDHLPKNCLLLADRLYGCGAFVLAAQETLQAQKSHFLFRVKEGLKVVRVLETLADGSRIVEIKALDPQNHHRVAATLQVREIRATITRAGFAPVKIRLWTSLMDCQKAPAHQLVELYARRWEQELYFRELKGELGINDLLRSQTVETGAQEVAAMIIGSSLIAHQRAKLQPEKQPSYRLSFTKVWETLEPLWLTLLLGADLLSETQKQALAERFYHLASTRTMAKKRTRSCPRAMRQPMQPWPKKRDQKGSTAPLTIDVSPN